jgi:hypothetical protein
MVTSQKATVVGIQKGEKDWDEKPGIITITDDGATGRVYFERENVSMAADLGDLIDTIKMQLAGGNK